MPLFPPSRLDAFTDAALLRQLCWDVSRHEHTENLMQRLGCNPASREVADHEHADAHGRIKLFADLLPDVTRLSELAAKAMAAYGASESGEHLTEAELHEHATAVHAYILIGTTVILGHLLDKGVLSRPHERGWPW
jgi:hypothetical protein